MVRYHVTFSELNREFSRFIFLCDHAKIDSNWRLHYGNSTHRIAYSIVSNRQSIKIGYSRTEAHNALAAMNDALSLVLDTRKDSEGECAQP